MPHITDDMVLPIETGDLIRNGAPTKESWTRVRDGGTDEIVGVYPPISMVARTEKVRASYGQGGRFNWSSQHPDMEVGVAWDDHVDKVLNGRGEHRCVGVADRAAISGMPSAYSGSVEFATL